MRRSGVARCATVAVRTAWARPARCVDAAGLAACAAWAWLAQASWEVTQVPVAGLLAALAVAWVATLAAWAAARGGGLGLRRVLVWALLFRAIGFVGEPVLEDDHYRYLWDGRSFATTGNPYADAPVDHFADPDLPERFQVVLDNVNHPTVPTLYPPVGEVVFLAGYGIAPGELWPLKAILLLLDLLAIALLARLASVASLLLYAWCPLLVQEVAFTAHVDVAGVFFLVAALVAYRHRRDAAVGALLALATGVKVLALVAAPALLLPGRWKAAAAFALTLGLVYAPFLLIGATGGGAGLHIFLDQWEFNSTGFAVAAALLGVPVAKLACGILFASFTLAFLASQRRVVGRSIPPLDLGFGVFFLLAPVVNAWYLLWMLPFVALRPSAWGLAALAVVPLAYVHGLSLPTAGLVPYEHPVWVRPLELGVVLLAAGWGRWSAREAEGDGDGRADDVLLAGVPAVERVRVE